MTYRWNDTAQLGSVAVFSGDHTGATDVRAGLQDLIDDVAANGGGDILVPPGRWRLSNHLTLPESLTGSMRILGCGGGTVFAPDTTAVFCNMTQGSTMQNLEIGGFTVDCATIHGNWAVIGSMHDSETGGVHSSDHARMVNWQNLYFHDINFSGASCNEAGGDHIYGIGLITRQNQGGDNATNNYIKDVVVERVKMTGGASCVTIAGLMYAQIGTVVPNSSSDTFYLAGHSYQTNDRVNLHAVGITSSSTGVLPAPLSMGVVYYVTNASGDYFKLATSSGGAAIDLTDVGIGNPYLYVAPNIDVDRITIRDIKHVPSAMVMTTHVHVGAYARVGKVRVENVYGENSGDNSIEINNAMDAIVDGATGVNCTSAPFYTKNYRPPTDVAHQKVAFRNLKAVSSDPTSHVDGFSVGSGKYGSIELDGLTYSTQNHGGLSVIVGSGNPHDVTDCARFTIRNLTADHYLNETLTESGYWYSIWLNDGGAGNHHLLENIRIHVHGAVNTSGYVFSWRGIAVEGEDVQFTLRDCWQRYDLTGYGAGTQYFIRVGAEYGSHVGLYLDGCRSTGTGTVTAYDHTGNTFDATHVEQVGDGCNFTT